MKILVRATNWLGDAVMSLPALRALRTRFPNAQITVLARPSVAPLYEGERSIDHVIPLTGSPGARDWATKWQLSSRLRREDFDLAVLLPNSFESAAIMRLSGARRRVGYARDGRSALLTDAIAVPRDGEIPRHECYYYLELLRRAGLSEGPMPVVTEILLDGLDAARARGDALFAARGVTHPVIGVSPGAAYGSAKRWLPERFAAAARELAAKEGASIVIFGAAGEKELCGEVAAACDGHNFAGLDDVTGSLSICPRPRRFCLANDFGRRWHIAAAVGVPCVTVFGPTDETATGPVGASAVMVRKLVHCAPCKLRECPIDHRCMTRVTVEQVVAAAALKGSANS